MKKVGILLCIGFLAYLAIEIGRNFYLIYPYAHFDYHHEYRRYSVYSDQSIDRKTIAILDNVTQRLNEIDIDIPERTFKIFICNTPTLYSKFAKMAGKPARSQGINIQPLYYTFTNSKYIEEVKDEYHRIYPHSLLQGDQAHIITHELIHELIALKVGFIHSRSLPNWKVEGYAEYYASHLSRKIDSTYSFKSQVIKYYDGQFNQLSPGHFHYLQSLIFVEYLISEKALTFQELFNNELTFEDVEEDLSKWHLDNN